MRSSHTAWPCSMKPSRCHRAGAGAQGSSIPQAPLQPPWAEGLGPRRAHERFHVLPSCPVEDVGRGDGCPRVPSLAWKGHRVGRRKGPAHSPRHSSAQFCSGPPRLAPRMCWDTRARAPAISSRGQEPDTAATAPATGTHCPSPTLLEGRDSILLLMPFPEVRRRRMTDTRRWVSGGWVDG